MDMRGVRSTVDIRPIRVSDIPSPAVQLFRLESYTQIYFFPIKDTTPDEIYL